MKKIAVLLISIISILSFSFDVKFNLNPKLDFDKLSTEMRFDLSHEYEYFKFLADMSLNSDEKYGTEQGGGLDKYYYYMNNGGVSMKYENIEFDAGIFEHYDEVHSPYSLFISSLGNNSMILNFRFEDDNFFYGSRWIRLNKNSALSYPDRGANYKVYGLKFGNIRFAYQDSIVYTGRYFDAEYFLNPIPNFFVQYINVSSGNPWQQNGNDNSIMGFLIDIEEDYYYAYAQILVDDINMNRFLKPEGYQNPDKIAWSLGGNFDTNFGNIGLYHAGATKYTFEPYGNSTQNTMYGYTYYPDVEYEVKTINKTILNEDNYIGYYNGENNISFMITYNNEKNSSDLLYKGSIEYSVSGSKSPANPWHEKPDWNSGIDGHKNSTKLLDESVLENKLIWKNYFKFNVLNNLSIGFRADEGYIFNKLKLVDAEPESEHNNIKYYKPSNENVPILILGIYFEYIWNIN